MTIMAFFTPFSGLGVQHALLRYGAIQERIEDKFNLYYDSIRRILLYTLPIVIVLIVLSKWICINLPGAQEYLMIMSLLLFTMPLYQAYNVFLRTLNRNKAYAYTSMTYTLIAFAISVSAAYFFTAREYAWGLVIAPLIVFLIVSRRWLGNTFSNITRKFNLRNITESEYLKYGLYVGLGSIASQMVLLMDNLLVGNIIADSDALAAYRVGAIIPLNLLFIPGLFFQADFVKLASEFKNKTYLKQYVLNYWKVFLLLTIGLLVPLYFMSDFLVVFLFGEKYVDSIPIFKMLIIAVVGGYLFRTPFGNILQAVGKSQWNAFNAYFMLAFNFVLTWYMTITYGIIGAAIASACAFWLSGIIGGGLFLFYLKTIGGAK
jgi:O-antigen/teichoic acid export membrane protein